MFTRFNGNVVPFADDATSTNRTVFGGVTQSDAIDDNLNADFKKGWEIVGLNDNPTREDFNAMGYTLGALTAYLYEMGISEWNASQNYRANSRVIGSDGKIYKSLTGTTGIPNVGNNPTTATVNWQVENVTDYSILANKTTPVDADLLALGDSASSFSLKKLTWANIKATLKTYFDTLYKVASSETVAGIIELATNAEAQAGTDDLRAITPLKLRNALNASGTAPIYACRAWVNFNGTGTVAIRASGNVSSITDNGVGVYTVNFTTPMVDSNYCKVAHNNGYVGVNYVINISSPSNNATTSTQIITVNTGTNTGADVDMINLSIFR